MTDLFLHILGHPVDGVLGVLVRAVNQRAAVGVERIARRLPLPLITVNVNVKLFEIWEKIELNEL